MIQYLSRLNVLLQLMNCDTLLYFGNNFIVMCVCGVTSERAEFRKNNQLETFLSGSKGHNHACFTI